MRIKHTLWRVNNGWLLVPEEKDGYLSSDNAPDCYIFKTLKEFSDFKPKRVRRKKAKPTPTKE